MRSLRVLVPVTLITLSLGFAPAQAATDDDPGGESFLSTLLDQFTSSSPSTTESDPPITTPESDPPASDPPTNPGNLILPPSTDPPNTDPPSTDPPNTDTPPAENGNEFQVPEAEPEEDEGTPGGPVANDDSYEMEQDSGPLEMSVTDNDTGNGIMAVQAQSQPSHGELNMTGMRTFSYTPEKGFTGNDSFTYQAKDAAQATSNTATVSLTVSPVGASNAESDSEETAELRSSEDWDEEEWNDGHGDWDDDDRCHMDWHGDWDGDEWNGDDGDVVARSSGESSDWDDDDDHGKKRHWNDDECDDDDDDVCERDDDDDDDWKHKKHWNDWENDWEHEGDGGEWDGGGDGGTIHSSHSDGDGNWDGGGDWDGDRHWDGDWDEHDDGDEEECDEDDDGDDDDGDDDGDEGDLPDTGAPGNLPLLALGGLLVIAGLTIARRARE